MKKIEKLKTFEDACKIENLDSTKVIPNFSCYPEADRKALEAHAKLLIIVKAANRIDNKNKEWIPNWENSNEYKYTPYFYIVDGSSGFRYDGYDNWATYTFVGSRLCFRTKEHMLDATSKFPEVYKNFMF